MQKYDGLARSAVADLSYFGLSGFFHSRGACRTCPRAHTHFLRASLLTSVATASSAVFSPKANTAVVAGASPAANRNPLRVLVFLPAAARRRHSARRSAR
jgi:hypothetical protein